MILKKGKKIFFLELEGVKNGILHPSIETHNKDPLGVVSFGEDNPRCPCFHVSACQKEMVGSFSTRLRNSWASQSLENWVREKVSFCTFLDQYHTYGSQDP